MKKLIFFLLLATQVFGQQKQKIIFDCDLGDDIDDAYALSLLLTMQDRYEILGITTCYGRTNDRARLAQRLLAETGQSNIPVYLGRNTSSQNERANWYAEQYYWAEGFNPASNVAPAFNKQLGKSVGRNPLKQKEPSASEFIRSSLTKYPGEVIIFSVGPVINFADVIDQDPEVLKKAKAIYAMFGSFRLGYSAQAPINAEWNVVVDVAAAKKFVHSGANIIYAGLDVTAMVKLDRANRDRILQRQSPLTNALSGLYVLWGNETPTLFDPVAIGMEAYPNLFQTEKVHIDVDDKGFTRIIPGKSPNAEIGISIDSKEFIDRLMKKYLYQNLQPTR
ncbi:MAG: nucleoside hydrolase [Bacteroidota bacterium]